jgi:murein L,D-transpeptidase YafK
LGGLVIGAVAILLLPSFERTPTRPDGTTLPPEQRPSKPSVIAKWIFNPGWVLRPPTDRDLIEEELVKRASHVQTGAPLPGTPDLTQLPARLAAQRLVLGAPIFMRIFKREFELELWIRKGNRFERFAVYPICNWSGLLGPKQFEGDRQAPEGFYTVDARSLNPKSNYHRSFNLGFPNAFDRAHGRTGTFLMVHGACASVGCYAMTNPVIDEIWTIVQAALSGGQRRFHVHIFPFRMTSENIEKYRSEPWQDFWQNLKEGYEAFETAKVPPRIGVCNLRYTVATSPPNSIGSEEIVSCPEPAAERRDLTTNKP